MAQSTNISKRNALLSALALCALLPASARAGITNYTHKADNIRNEIIARQTAHALLIHKSDILNAQVSTLRKNLVHVTRSLRNSENNLSQTAATLQDLEQKKNLVIQKLYKDQQAMGGLVAAIRKYSEMTTPDMLMQTNPIDAARASLVMKSVMPRLQKQAALLKAELSEIKKIENSIQQQKNLQTAQTQKLDRQQNTLSALLAERQKLYKSTESQRHAQEVAVEKLTKESKNIEDLIRRLKLKEQHSQHRAYLSGGKGGHIPGHLVMPVQGKIFIAFGQKNQLGARSEGITFSTRKGATVVAPLAGIVRFAGPFQKYKQILIIEHKGGYHSLITGLARIDTVVGASLAAGEPVGVAQTSGSPQVYFELRHDGKPINPQRLLLAQLKQEKS